MDAPWTLEQLTARVADATKRLGLLQANGQVAEVPNARAIRWYQSTGLIRRPAQRGRVAFYGVAHLREIVAIKRLQAQGLTLDQVQQQLQGKSDDDVRVLAGVPPDIEADSAGDIEGDVAGDEAVPAVVAGGGRSFWAADAADAVVAGAIAVTGDADDSDDADVNVKDVVDVKEGRAFTHPSGVTVVLPTTVRAPTTADAQAILSAVVSQLVARGLLASSVVTVSTPAATKEEE